MQKIAVVLRTLNERPHLARFLWGYDWVDHILVADGGSTDGTQEFLSSHPKVSLCEYTVNITHPKTGVVRNPEGAHINFLLDWAGSIGVDWTILDDADGCPNFVLRKYGREVLEAESADSLYAFRMYIWGTEEWFPDLTGGSLNPGPEWSSLWAWRSGLVRWSEEDPFKSVLEDPYLESVTKHKLPYPSALLHYFCLTPEIAERKRMFYSQTLDGGLQPQLESCGPLRRLPSWAHP
jgi:hypothetical protein